MKPLWTPWRMEHVLGASPAYHGCLFEPPGDATFDKTHLLLFRDELTVVLLNRFPYANGPPLLLLPSSCTVIRRHLHPQGINTGLNLGKVAGAGIADHLHFHLVPRWEDDHNFITVCADIRTIPQHIERTFDLLLDDFQQLLQQPTP